MDRRQFNSSLAATGASLATGRALAQPAPVEGKDYVRVHPPLAVPAGPGKIDVVEFFSYACPHCFELEPALEAWTRRQPAKVAVRRVPVPFLFNYQNLQPMYYALESLKLLDTMQIKVFNALHVEHQQLVKPGEIAALMSKNGVDPARFMAAFDSFSVRLRVKQGNDLMETAGVTEVPTLIVQGSDRTSLALGGGPEGTVRVLDHLVAKAAAGH